jgi:hypothetical protein
MTASLDFNGFSTANSTDSSNLASSSTALLNQKHHQTLQNENIDNTFSSSSSSSASSDFSSEKDHEMSQLASLTAAATSALEGVSKGKEAKTKQNKYFN